MYQLQVLHQPHPSSCDVFLTKNIINTEASNNMHCNMYNLCVQDGQNHNYTKRIQQAKAHILQKKNTRPLAGVELLALVASKQPGKQVDRQGEDIGVVVLSRDGMQGLEVSQL